MNWWPVLVALLAGIAIGLGLAVALKVARTGSVKELADEMFRESEARRVQNTEALFDNVKSAFGSLSLEALSRSTEEFLKLAKSQLGSEREAGAKELEGKKLLIDQQMVQMNSVLDNALKLVKDLELDRERKFAQLEGELKKTNEHTQALSMAAGSLREALAGSKSRGQWGERMAEDVLRLAGFREGVNYEKQKTIEGAGSRPDFTFPLPSGLRLNMDVKFPFDNYVKCVECASEADKSKFRADFLRDVRSRMKEITTRDYINSETVDYVLLFIPNEQVYAFIHENDGSLLDDGIKNKVLFCSPVTLFAVLAVVRQAADSFAVSRKSDEIQKLLVEFGKHWTEFVDRMDVLGKRLVAAQEEYQSLVTTRRKKLEAPLQKIEALRSEHELPAAREEREGQGQTGG